MKLALSLMLCAVLLMGCMDKNEGEESVNTQSIGQATMTQDGVLILRLRAESDDGATGESMFTYGPTDKEYQDILKHIGGLDPGQSKPVPPWDE